jgi:hypothetical protein
MNHKQINFDEADWQRIENAWSLWWAGELQRPIVMIEGLDSPLKEAGVSIHNLGELVINLAKRLGPDEILEYYENRLVYKHFYGDAFPRWRLTFGPGIAAGFLGAKVFSTPETAWFEPAELLPIDQVTLEYQEKNTWWLQAQELTRKAVEKWGNSLVVAHTDIGGNFDILASLRTTQQMLFELYDSPEDVARLIHQITGLWIRYYNELHMLIKPAGRGTSTWAPIWSPGRCYMLQSDFSYMLSPKMFERYILPDLDACTRVLDHSLYHLDGKGEIPHLGHLLSMEHLHGIQWIPGDGAPPPEEWLDLLKRIRDAGRLVQLFVKPEGALKIARALGGKGFAFYIDQLMDREQAKDFIRTINSV